MYYVGGCPYFYFIWWVNRPSGFLLFSYCLAVSCCVISCTAIKHQGNVTAFAGCQTLQTGQGLHICYRFLEPDIRHWDWLQRVTVSFSIPSTRANDETGPSKPADDVDHQVKGAVARPVSTGCPTVELELNRRFDGEWERNGMRNGGCELVSKVRRRISPKE